MEGLGSTHHLGLFHFFWVEVDWVTEISTNPNQYKLDGSEENSGKWIPGKVWFLKKEKRKAVTGRRSQERELA